IAVPQATTQPQNRQPVRVHLDPVVVQPQQLRTWQLSWVEHKSDNVVNLVRSTYKLPQAKAEVLAAFLREHVKAKVIETKVEGNSLTITTTLETQKAVDVLMGVILDKATAAKDKTGATRETWVQPVLSEKLDAEQLKLRTMREATFR